MIPAYVTREHILEAVERIGRDGVPTGRRSRKYCLECDGCHYPPKYTIALAHEIATGSPLSSAVFSGGSESIRFLVSYGFDVDECRCGGICQIQPTTSPLKSPPKKKASKRPKVHSERCRECKMRVRELLDRIYGSCRSNHRFDWRTHLSAYEGTSIYPALRNVAAALKEHRGFGVGDFIKAKKLAGCDFWVPNPGFIVEFDESQHFSTSRMLALSNYPDNQPLRFSRQRWIALCEKHDAKDNDPPYRDEQRAWYDTLRDLVPLLDGLKPTLRLYARDFTWCSLDPDREGDRRRFLDVACGGSSSARRTPRGTNSPIVRGRAILRGALVFPEVDSVTMLGVPPSGTGAQQPEIPSPSIFAGETVDFVLFPEAYISTSDDARIRKLSRLASGLRAPLLVGAVERRPDSTGRKADWQVLLFFDADGSYRRLYAKHSTSDAVAFESPDWEASAMLPIFELGSVSAGATICHDHYLGLLPRFLAKQGALVWVNPSFDNVIDIKWSSVLRLRAVENRFFALCTLHDSTMKRTRTHPFAFSPDGKELMARQVGYAATRRLSKCKEPGTIYVVDLDMSALGKPLDWSRIPWPKKPKTPRPNPPGKPVRTKMSAKRPAVCTVAGWLNVEPGQPAETDQGLVYVGVIREAAILDAAECFQVLGEAEKNNAVPIIWNLWNELPTHSPRVALLMMGRAIECCAPILISDRAGIHEVVELANRIKIPVRRPIEPSGEAIVDLDYAWGLRNAFKIVSSNLPPASAVGRRNAHEYKRRALERYQSLA